MTSLREREVCDAIEKKKWKNVTESKEYLKKNENYITFSGQENAIMCVGKKKKKITKENFFVG